MAHEKDIAPRIKPHATPESFDARREYVLTASVGRRLHNLKVVGSNSVTNDVEQATFGWLSAFEHKAWHRSDRIACVKTGCQYYKTSAGHAAHPRPAR
jgi:hypothetical protein